MNEPNKDVEVGDDYKFEKKNKYQNKSYDSNNGVELEDGVLSYVLIFLARILFVIIYFFSFNELTHVAADYERIVIFRLGRALGGLKGPGLFFTLPFIDEVKKIDLRTIYLDVDVQEMLTKDSVTVWVDAVLYYSIFDPLKSIMNVEDVRNSTKLLAQSSLRNAISTKSLSQLLTDRTQIIQQVLDVLDKDTDEWGVRVERVELKSLSLPESMQRSMAAEAEAIREAKAKIIIAEGEHDASIALKQAAQNISGSDVALSLRYLQTLSQLATETPSVVVFPIPIDVMPKQDQHQEQ